MARRHVKSCAALAVSRQVNYARCSGYVERRAVAERGDLEDRRRPKHPLGERETYEAQGGEADAEHLLVLWLRLPASHLRIELVDAHRHAPLAAQALREADVVDMGVGEHECANVTKGPTHERELIRKILPVAGGARVDDGDLASLLEQIRVDQPGAEPVDARRDPHLLLFGSAVAATVS